MNIASYINQRSFASFSTTLNITFLQTSDEREEGLANDVSVRKQCELNQSVHEVLTTFPYLLYKLDIRQVMRKRRRPQAMKR